MGSLYLNLPYLLPRLTRHFLPEKLVRALLLRSVIIRPGLETSNPFAAVQRYVDVLAGHGGSSAGSASWSSVMAGGLTSVLDC